MLVGKYSAILPPDVKTPLHMTMKERHDLEKEMRPGVSSGAGFLTADEKLYDVCVADYQYLLDKGITCRQISETLLGIILKAKEVKKPDISPEATVSQFKVTWVSSNGTQECPFGECHKGRSNYTIENTTTKKVIEVSELGIALINDHAFFQGNTDYRIDPEEAIACLGLVKGQHKPITKTFYEWVSGDVEIDKKEMEQVKEKAKKVVEKDDLIICSGVKEKDGTYTYIYNMKDRDADLEVDGMKILSNEGTYVFKGVEKTFVQF